MSRNLGIGGLPKYSWKKPPRNTLTEYTGGWLVFMTAIDVGPARANGFEDTEIDDVSENDLEEIYNEF